MDGVIYVIFMVERLGCIFELWSDGILMQIHLHETGPIHALVSHLGQLSIVTKIRAENCWSSEARDIQITSVVRGAGVGPD